MKKKIKFNENLLLAIFTLFLVLQLHINFFVEAAPKPKKPNQVPPKSQTSNNDSIFEKAKKELPEDLYTAYRIVERLARANDITQTPWRLQIVDEYDINAYATEVNLITIYTGFIDQLKGDISAIAFVLAHEMAHHTKRHQAIEAAELATLKEKIQTEAQEQAKREVESTKFWNNIGNALNGLNNSLYGGSSNPWNYEQLSQQALAQAEEKARNIIAQKNVELEAKIAEQKRKYEFEADEAGYKYMATAGFDPEGCMRAMIVIGRTSGAEIDSNHPAVPKRRAQLEELMKQYPANDLKNQGSINLKTVKPLTYAPSNDGKSLRINSQTGSNSSADPFNSLDP